MTATLGRPPDPSWERFAEREPYFAVLSAPQFRHAHLTEESRAAFFASGEHLVAWMLDIVNSGLLPDFAPMSVLEHGCGVGRLAIPLATRFGSVTAVDRSPAMLAQAKREAEQRGIDHIDFRTAVDFHAAPRRFDLVVCYQVLQRLEHQEGLALARALSELIAPNGIGVLHWPMKSHASLTTKVARSLRQRMPATNRVANVLRGKPWSDPFVPTETYAFEDVWSIFEHEQFVRVQAEFEHDRDMDAAVLFARRRDQPLALPQKADAPAAPITISTVSSRAGDVRAEATAEEIDRWNRTAELYFSTLTHWDHHLAKPFSNVEEAPILLMGVSVALQSLDLLPGMTVLEFGAGSGWLSRFITQMGCRSIVLDVSATALDIARELYRRQPPIGEQPPPAFLHFDGVRIAIDDASVDRVLCFDSFHHAANPEHIIREFGRILVDAGVVTFVEPGPKHADAPRSQFESSTYGVVERDVDVHAIWRTAQRCGFGDLRLSVFNGAPYDVSLREFEGLLAGGPEQDGWLAATRQFLRYARTFRLIKGESATADSRRSVGLACEIRASLRALRVPPSTGVTLDVVVKNTGTAIWLPPEAGRGGVSLGVHLFDAEGQLVDFEFHRARVSEASGSIAPGAEHSTTVTLPLLPPGRYSVEIDCVASDVIWFAQKGSRPVTVSFEVASVA